jgi:NADP-dependent 3-hydroxy acid dehydrogenase YdfG
VIANRTVTKETLAATSPTKGKIKNADFHGVARNEVGLAYLPQPDQLEFSLPDAQHVLLTNEGTALTATVIAQLKAMGNKVVVLNLPGIKNPIVENGVTVAAHADVAIGEAIQKAQNTYGKTGAFIHLHPHFEFQNGNFTQHFSQERDIVQSLFFIAKHLQATLNELGKNQRAAFLTVTRMDGQLGQGKRGNVSIIAGGIKGLVKCLNLEWSPVFCRSIDIQPELAVDDIARQILLEWKDANTKMVEVAYSNEGRKTSSVCLVSIPEGQEIQTNVSADSVFLVSGGARGVTATCVVEMAKVFKCKFILLGRSDYSYQVPAFAKNETDEGQLKRLIMTDLKDKGEAPSLAKVKSIYNNIIAKKEIEETIAQIESHGAKVIYIQGDATNIATFKIDLVVATEVLGPITGIIHGAGRLADKYIQDKTEADFNNVLTVKLDGLLALLAAVNIHKLEHLILFSSVAGFYGNVGQTDYAIANEILSAAAHLFKTNHPNTHVSAINWGAWDSGMVSGELKAQFEAAGVTLVNSEGGAAMMVNELNIAYADQPQVIIGGTLPAAVSYLGDLRTHRIHRKLALESNPFLKHHVIQGHAVLPVVNAVGWMAQTCEQLYPDYRVFKVANTKLFKGIVFDGSQKENYIVEVKELSKSVDEIVFETTVLSEGGKLPTFHYKATITLRNKKSIPAAPKVTHQLSGKYSPTDGAILYKDGSLFHKDYFRGIQQILECNEQHIILSCKAPEVPLKDQGQFAVNSVNTFFADIQYQGMLVWVQKNMDGAKSLPLQTDSAIMYKEMPFGKVLLVKVTCTERTEYGMVADCVVYDQEGTVYMHTQGAAVTISRELVW